MQWQKLKKIHIRLFRDIPAHELRITIPTMLTILRIIFVPCIIVSMFMQQWGMAFLFFLTASITDFLDGNLARLWNEKTFLGACLDPIADKLLLISFFFTLVFIKTPLFSVPLWFVLLVLLKELIVIFGALFILLSGRHLDVRPTWLGKSTTVVQMAFIIWLFACYYFHWVPVKTYYSMLAIMLLMVFLSFVQYIRMGFKQTTMSS
jgi:cardiolipin synthase